MERTIKIEIINKSKGEQTLAISLEGINQMESISILEMAKLNIMNDINTKRK